MTTSLWLYLASPRLTAAIDAKVPSARNKCCRNWPGTQRALDDDESLLRLLYTLPLFFSLSLPYNGLPYIPFLGGLDSPVKRRVNWISRKRSLSLVRSRRHLTPFHGRPPPPNCNRRTRGTDRRTNTYAAIPWAGHTQDEWRLDAIYKKRYVTYLLSTYSRNLLRRNPLMKTRYTGLRRISLHVRNALEGMSAESKKTNTRPRLCHELYRLRTPWVI